MTAGIIGATGYTGAELARILPGHPGVTRLCLASASQSGRSIDAVYPNFFGVPEFSGPGGICNPVLEEPDRVIAASDIVFGALPSGTGEEYAKKCLERGISYIDLSADFRFDDEETYKTWYGTGWRCPEIHRRSVYGLPECMRNEIKALAASGPLVVGNPGCYPTAITLAAAPALSFLGEGTIIADAVSGVSGAGREPGRAYHFPECSDSASAYRAGNHRHSPEISRNIARAAGKAVPVVFTPHLGPFNRGILATVYIPLAGPETTPLSVIRERYGSCYRNETFVRLLPEETHAATNRVRGSNYCDISLHMGQDGKTLIAIAAIDNMVKGAVGQAVQNMNIIAGFEETSGLTAIPALF